MLTIERGDDAHGLASPPSIVVAAPRARSRSLLGTVMRLAAAFTIVAVGGLSMVMARRTPTLLTDATQPAPIFSTEAPMELANLDLPYSRDRVPVRAVVSVVPAVLPIQELSDYSDEELTLLMQQLDDWDGAPPVDSVRLVPLGNDSVIQGSS